MLVKMLLQVSGSRDGQDWPMPGSVMDLPDEEAVTLCSNRSAIPFVEPESRVEKAILERALPDVEHVPVPTPTLVEAREALVPRAVPSPTTSPPSPASVPTRVKNQPKGTP